MLIPEFKKYPKGEYSLIQISPTTDSSELINIGVIVKNLETNEIEFKLFEDIWYCSAFVAKYAEA